MNDITIITFGMTRYYLTVCGPEGSSRSLLSNCVPLLSAVCPYSSKFRISSISYTMASMSQNPDIDPERQLDSGRGHDSGMC